MKKNYVIYSMKIAIQLTYAGFTPVRTSRNYKDLTKTVWYFEDTEEFRAALKNILAAQ